jgi:zinc transporter
MTGLMLPATFVTGLFGMNTGGFPWHDSPHGTLWATVLAFGAAAATYLLLRRIGLMRR